MQFIWEIFWLLDADPKKKDELKAKPTLGLKAFIDILRYPWNEKKNLHHDSSFLRNKIIAHQDGPYQVYSGPKVNDEEVYLDALVMVSLRLLRKGLPLVIRNLGVRLLQLVLELLIENSTCCKVGAMVEARGSSILKNEFCSHAGPWRDEAGPEMVDEELHSSCVDDDISGLGSKEHVDDCYH
ncbi:uncharacterized protein LOC133908977 isoform X1 [Phragmites australis]|uniref:uncharacterized protein LOC133908977 isoform X1 n=1 Tax=Phragmites australis TaxID=29695 RepID=UPI002D77961D|nr:uncharacterized protein LOC133908977 isoform X1 [Phragmites australis]